jgi:hypothetical protein
LRASLYPSLPPQETPPAAPAPPSPSNANATRRSAGADAAHDASDGEAEEQEQEHQAGAEKDALESDELAQCWLEVFAEAGLPHAACEAYALGFSRHGVDDSNAGALTDAELEANGIADASHRATILGLVAGLVEQQQERGLEQEQGAMPGAAQGHDAPAPAGKAPTWEDVRAAERDLAAEITKVDRLTGAIAKILAGDTDKQRALRARLAQERARRAELRAERAQRAAQRTLERARKGSL